MKKEELKKVFTDNSELVRRYASDYNDCGEFDTITMLTEDFEDLYFENFEKCALAVSRGDYNYMADYYTLNENGAVVSIFAYHLDRFTNKYVSDLVDMIECNADIDFVYSELIEC